MKRFSQYIKEAAEKAYPILELPVTVRQLDSLYAKFNGLYFNGGLSENVRLKAIKADLNDPQGVIDSLLNEMIITEDSCELTGPSVSDLNARGFDVRPVYTILIETPQVITDTELKAGINATFAGDFKRASKSGKRFVSEQIINTFNSTWGNSVEVDRFNRVFREAFKRKHRALLRKSTGKIIRNDDTALNETVDLISKNILKEI